MTGACKHPWPKPPITSMVWCPVCKTFQPAAVARREGTQ